MRKLCRQIRFTVNPFLEEDADGFNSFAGKPCGQGVGVFFELCVSLVGKADSDTGFIVNIVDIDKQVRALIVPIFSGLVRAKWRGGEHVSFGDIFGVMRESADILRGCFGSAIVSDLTFKLNPYRKISMDCEDYKMSYFSEKFEFAAMHKLWNEEFGAEKNFEVFGKCANPSGHGHNYTLEVTVRIDSGGGEFKVGEFERLVDELVIEAVDHKNLNKDVDGFAGVIPTIENIAEFAWGKLEGAFGDAKLHSVTVWETDKTCCTYYG